MFTPGEESGYWGQSARREQRGNMSRVTHTVVIMTVVMMSVTGQECQVERALGMKSGEILDSQVTASSQFTNAVGPTMGRLGSEAGGGAWCPRGMVSRDEEERQWLEVDLGRRVRVTSVSVQGRWGGGLGQEWSPMLAVSWLDTDKDIMVATDQVYRANTDTYSVVRINLTQANIVTSILRVIPVSEHPRAVCLRLEIHGCDVDNTGTETLTSDVDNTGTETVTVRDDIGGDLTDRDQEIVGNDEAVEDDARIVNDDRKEIIKDPDQVTQLTEGHLFPVLLTVLAAVSTLLIILSALLLRTFLCRVPGSRKLPVSQPVNDLQYFQPGPHHHNQHNNHQLPIIKKNIYEVPKVEPIYSTPIEIFYPSSPSTLSTDSSECESLKAKTIPAPKTVSTSTPRHGTMGGAGSYKTPRKQTLEDLVTFSPIYSYFSPSGEPKYSNIV